MHFKSAKILIGLLLVHTVFAASAQTASREALIGTWSTVNFFGQLVNPGYRRGYAISAQRKMVYFQH